MWLLQPGDRAGRITRRPAMQRNEVRTAHRTAHRIRDLLNNPGPTTKQQALADLYAAMVRAKADTGVLAAGTAELIWSACSALAHGDTHGAPSACWTRRSPPPSQ